MCTFRQLFRIISDYLSMFSRRLYRDWNRWLNICETTPLHVAVQQGNEVEALRLIIEEWADVDKKDEFGFSSLEIAANFDNFRMLQLISPYSVHAEFNLNLFTSEIISRKFRALDLEYCWDEIYAYHPGLDIQAYIDYAPLQMLVELLPERSAEIRKLLDDGCDPHVCDNRGNNCLHTIALLGNLISACDKRNLALLFIEKGVDINAKNVSKNTPLHLAIRHEPSIVALLLKNGAEVNHLNIVNMTVFDLALRLNKSKVFPLLVKYTVLAKHRGVPIIASITQSIETNPLLHARYIKFEKHMEKLRATKITASYDFTYRDILILGGNKVAKLLENDEIRGAILAYNATHNSFENDMLHVVYRALRIRKNEAMTFKILDTMFDNKLPYLCAKRIFSFINIRDTKLLMAIVRELPGSASSSLSDEEDSFSN